MFNWVHRVLFANIEDNPGGWSITPNTDGVIWRLKAKMSSDSPKVTPFISNSLKTGPDCLAGLWKSLHSAVFLVAAAAGGQTAERLPDSQDAWTVLLDECGSDSRGRQARLPLPPNQASSGSQSCLELRRASHREADESRAISEMERPATEWAFGLDLRF